MARPLPHPVHAYVQGLDFRAQHSDIPGLDQRRIKATIVGALE